MNHPLRIGIAVAGLLSGGLFADTPQWWNDRTVIDTNLVANDYAPVNQGQAKHMAVQAWLEFDHKLTNDCSAVSNLVDGFSTTNNWLPLNLGQLKYLAAPFYDLLWADGLTNAWPEGMTDGPYPWSGLTHAPNDFAAANIGQLKYLFSFNPATVASDTDGDGLPDWWELQHFGDALAAAALDDADSDGANHLAEFQNGLDPNNDNSYGDGIPDGIHLGMRGTTGEDGLLIVLPGGQFRHVTESLLDLNAYGAYGN